ncbi:hypothetical protein SNEBB_003419 [Seison nebaliae]|nr:hypothetical protein SNEBB_003419 [Seison nebaliae]
MLAYHAQGNDFVVPFKHTLSTSARVNRLTRSWNEYQFELRHTPGNANFMADFLSRSASMPAEREEIDVTANCYVLDATATQPNVSLPYRHIPDSEFKNAQSKDPQIMKLISQLGELPKLGRRANNNMNYFIDDNGVLRYLYARENNYRLLAYEQIVVPVALQKQVIANAHNSEYAGHSGIAKTWNQLRKSYCFVNMIRSIKDFIAKCHTCQIKKSPPCQVNAPFASYVPKDLTIGVNSYIDIVGPFPRSKQGHAYVLTVLDHFSRFLTAYPLKSKKAEEIACALQTQFQLYGKSSKIICDNSQEFRSRSFESPSQAICEFMPVIHEKARSLLESAIDSNRVAQKSIHVPDLKQITSRRGDTIVWRSCGVPRVTASGC